MLSEFKPALKFLLVFLGLYFIGNILYGLMVESFREIPDPVTRVVANQTANILQRFGQPVTTIGNTKGPTVFLKEGDKTILNIYEGCNGINVMIVFIAFLVAFGGAIKKLAWFLPLGIVIIHLSNLVRLVLLYFVAINYYSYFYYVHKYIFTALLYLIVVLLWIVWVGWLNAKPKKTKVP